MSEVEELVAQECGRGFIPEEPLLRSLVIPSKDPSKIFVYLMVDQVASDGLSLLNCLSQMQDETQRKENRIMINRREAVKIDSTKVWKALQKIKEIDEEFKSTNRVGKGIRNGRISYSVSEDINLTELKRYA